MGTSMSSMKQHHPTTKISPCNGYVPTHTHYLVNENQHVILLRHQLEDGSPAGCTVKCQITEGNLICECEGCHTNENLLSTDEDP
jgi:hypothetical protein